MAIATDLADCSALALLASTVRATHRRSRRRVTCSTGEASPER